MGVAAMAATLAGCAQNEPANLPDNGERIEVKLTAEIAGEAVATPANPQTRLSADGNSWSGGEGVGVSVFDENATLADNVLYTVASNGTMTADSEPAYYPQSGEVDIVAYYPYAQGGSISVNLAYAQTDVLYAKVTGKAKSQTPVALQFEHVLSKITLNVKAGAGMTTGNISGIASNTVSFRGMPSSATFAKDVGELGSETVGAFSPTKAATPASGYQATFTSLLIPQVGTAGRSVTFSVLGPAYVWAIPDATAFEAGKHYVFNVTVNETEVTVDGITIASWEDGGDVGAGSGNAELITYAVGDVYPNPLLGPAIGVVYEVDGTGQHGKVVDFYRAERAWGPFIEIGASSRDDGLVNMAAIKNYIINNGGDYSLFPAFEWANGRNDAAHVYASGQKGVYYIPAIDELMVLFNVWKSGLFDGELTAALGLQGVIIYPGRQLSSTEVQGTHSYAKYEGYDFPWDEEMDQIKELSAAVQLIMAF